MAVTTNLFQAGVMARPFRFFRFLLLSFPFPLFPRLQVLPSNAAKGSGGALLAPLVETKENKFCSHQTRFLGSKYTKNAYLDLAANAIFERFHHIPAIGLSFVGYFSVGRI